jgi:hypothetical protein
MQIYSDPTRDRVIRVRVNEEEYQAFFEQAHKQGYKNLSDFLRSLIKKSGEANGRKN